MATMRKILCIMSVMATLVGLCMAVDHTVGDTTGWDTASDIKTWASTQKFQVGDNLVFKYSSPMHSVVEVLKSDYDSCQSNNAIETHTGGSTTVALKSPGKRFFICVTPGHCDMGMKLEVETLATAASPPPPKAAPPPSAIKSGGASSPPSSTPKSIGSPPPSSTPKNNGSPPPSTPEGAAPTAGPRPPVMDVPTASPISPSTTKSPAPAPAPASVQSGSPGIGGLRAGLVVGWFVAVVMVLAF